MRLAGTIAVASLSLVACVTQPYSGTAVEPAATSVGFAGVASYRAGDRVRVEFEEASGAFTLLGEATVTPSNAWSVTVPVPDRAWRLPPCGSARFRFRTPAGGTVAGQDAACLAAAGPSPTLAQRAACLVPHLELFRGRVHAGDLIIRGQAQADANACLTVVDGNLTLEGDRVPVAGIGYAPGVTFTMPRLREVRGSLAIDGGRTSTFTLPVLERVGGDLSLLSYQFIAVTLPPGGGTPAGAQGVNRFDLPALLTVGGSVDLRNAQDTRLGGGSVTHEVGLDTLASVGGDVRVQQVVFPSFIVGLRGLFRIPRDLVFDGGGTDVDSADLLPGLGSVGRDVALRVNPNARTAFRALTTVGRNVTVEPTGSSFAIGSNFLTGLGTVGGDLTLAGVVQGCGRDAFPALRSVAGTLRFPGGRPEGAFGSTGPAPLVLGGLELSSTASAFVPLHGDVTMIAKGPVSFVGNTNLCTCQIAAFASGLAARGWGGVVVGSGNGTAAACTTCPSPACP